MTTNELRAAAEYVLGTGDGLAVEDDECAGFEPGEIESYIWSCARENLREHPVDSDEPITEPWLRSVGFSRPMTPANDTCLVAGSWTRTSCEDSPAPTGVYPVQYYRTHREAAGMWYVYENPLPVQPETRADLRRLAAALGIQLKEGK